MSEQGKEEGDALLSLIAQVARIEVALAELRVEGKVMHRQLDLLVSHAAPLSGLGYSERRR